MAGEQDAGDEAAEALWCRIASFIAYVCRTVHATSNVDNSVWDPNGNHSLQGSLRPRGAGARYANVGYHLPWSYVCASSETNIDAMG